MKKRVLSLLLVFVLAFSCLGTTVLAASQYSSDYRQWSQGASGYSRVRSYGCFIVSMARMIVESGVDTSSSFNPDVFAKWEEDTGHITSLDYSIGQNDKLGPQEYAEQKGKKLTYLGPVSYSDDTLWHYINNGNYCIVHIGYKNGSHHYVFVSNGDSKNNGELMFYETGTSSKSIGVMNKSKLLSRYKNSSITTIYVYEGDAKNICNHKYIASSEKCEKCGEKFVRSYSNVNQKYKVIKNNVSVKSQPYSECGEIYTRLNSGTIVNVKRSFKNIYNNLWYEVSVNGITGYMFSGNLAEYVEEKASNLYIDLTEYPTSLKKGSNFGLRGTVKSSYHTIKKVNGYIKQGNNIIQSTTDTPNSGSLNVKSANLNKNLIFGNLGVGNYALVVEATDSSGKTISVTKYFSVYEEQKRVDSNLSINLDQYPVSINQGSSFGLRGSINSNYTIVKVRGYVKNSNGSVVLSSSDTPNSTSMNIRYADLNNSLVFNKLSAGNYTMIVEATDNSGRVVTATKNFTVRGNSAPPVDNSSIGTGVTGTVNIPSSWDDLSIRSGPSTNYQIVGSMRNGVQCTVYPNKTSNGWYYVNYNGVWGYASGNQISIGSSSSNTRTGVVNIPSSWDDLSIRSGPSTNYQIVGSMLNGARCTVYPDKASNGWYYVEYNGVKGYAAGNRINLQ